MKDRCEGEVDLVLHLSAVELEYEWFWVYWDYVEAMAKSFSRSTDDVRYDWSLMHTEVLGMISSIWFIKSDQSKLSTSCFLTKYICSLLCIKRSLYSNLLMKRRVDWLFNWSPLQWHAGITQSSRKATSWLVSTFSPNFTVFSLLTYDILWY